MPDHEPAQGTSPAPAAPATDQDDESESHRVGSGGDDKSAGISVSGVGGEELTSERRDAGLPPADEQGARLGWGQHPAADDALDQAAGNEGTGQAERPDGD